jgi:hypothetical protein
MSDVQAVTIARVPDNMRTLSFWQAALAVFVGLWLFWLSATFLGFLVIAVLTSIGQRVPGR